MGIKFYCPNGHKLHVKSFLAGKRGVCPHCDARVEIPFESQSADSRNAAANGSSAGPVMSPHAVAAPVAVSPPAAPAPLSAPPAAELSPVSIRRAPATVPVAVPVGQPAFGSASAPSAPSGGPHAPTDRDPLREAPEAVWYVRPPSGGQFGPARGETMDRWMSEGRVTADSLVWRDGWEDWREAGDVFPQLPTPPAGSPLGDTAADSAALPDFSIQDTTPAPRRLKARRRRSPILAIAAVVTLVLVSLALLVTLVLVLSNQG